MSMAKMHLAKHQANQPACSEDARHGPHRGRPLQRVSFMMPHRRPNFGPDSNSTTCPASPVPATASRTTNGREERHPEVQRRSVKSAMQASAQHDRQPGMATSPATVEENMERRSPAEGGVFPRTPPSSDGQPRRPHQCCPIRRYPTRRLERDAWTYRSQWGGATAGCAPAKTVRMVICMRLAAPGPWAARRRWGLLSRASIGGRARGSPRSAFGRSMGCSNTFSFSSRRETSCARA